MVSLVHPIEGNEAAIGLDYRDSAEQFLVIQDMMDVGGSTITGPVKLVQGGLGLILRTPFYRPYGDNPGTVPRPLGLVSIVFDYQKFLDKVGVSEAALSYDLLMDRAGEGGGSETVIFGDKAVEDNDPVTLEFDFPFGKWNLHATAKGGWPQSSPTQWRERMIMAEIAVGVLLLLGYIVWLAESRKRAKTLLNQGIEALDDGFAMFDSNDRLILSNEKYREMFGLPKNLMVPGTPFGDQLDVALKRQLYTGDPDKERDWKADRLLQRLNEERIDLELHLLNGRVIKGYDRRMPDGNHVALRVDVTALSEAKAAAEDASKAKTDFMGVLSHELRTPLTVILGVARLASNARLLKSSKTLLAALETGDRSPAEIRKMLDDMFGQLSGLMDRMVRSGDHLLHLINEMLDFTKIESGSLSITCATCDIKDIVDPIAEQLSTLSREKGLAFEVTQAPGTVCADMVRARQILLNLVGNAIKFTECGYVRLVVKVDAGEVAFEVHDNGPGIAETEFDNIFDAFYQIDSTAARRANGTGMGLAISRNLAELQGGSLTVTSTLGEGSCFVLTLPSVELMRGAETVAAA